MASSNGAAAVTGKLDLPHLFVIAPANVVLPRPFPKTNPVAGSFFRILLIIISVLSASGAPFLAHWAGLQHEIVRACSQLEYLRELDPAPYEDYSSGAEPAAAQRDCGDGSGIGSINAGGGFAQVAGGSSTDRNASSACNGSSGTGGDAAGAGVHRRDGDGVRRGGEGSGRGVHSRNGSHGDNRVGDCTAAVGTDTRPAGRGAVPLEACAPGFVAAPARISASPVSIASSGACDLR